MAGAGQVAGGGALAHTSLMPNAAYAAVMLAAGIGIPVLAALNAALGQRIGAPFAAGATAFAVAFLVACAVAVLTGQAPALAKLRLAPPHLFAAGALIAFYLLSITWIAPRFGVGNAVFFVLLGQMVSAALIDHFGLFGAKAQTLSAARAGGIALMAVGVWLTQRG